MPSKRIKKSFTAGVLDPLLGARVDFAKYKDGCRVLKNMVSLPTGGATRRPGTEFIADMSALMPPAGIFAPLRQIPFVEDSEGSLMLFIYEATDGEIYMVHAAGAALQGSVTAISAALPETGADFDLEAVSHAQYGYNIHIAQKGVAPFYLEYLPATGTWNVVPISFTAQPTEWGAGQWPETVTFHQQRSYWGGNEVRPQAIWASAIGEPYNMGPHSTSPGAEVDGFTFQLESNIWDHVAWMYSDKVLNVGTLGQEWIVTGLGGSGPITQKSVQATIQTNVGTSRIIPIKIGGALNFVGRYGRSIYEFQYNFANDNYMAADKSILAQHLTRRNEIESWGYQRTPYGVLWCKGSRDLLGCTLVPEHKVAAWHEHETQGTFHTLATMPEKAKGQDTVWMTVARQVYGVSKLYIERLAYGWADVEVESQRFFLDSYLRFSGPGAMVTGLDHLKGLTVSIWADGMTHPDVEVSNAGEVELNYDGYSSVIVGLGYVSEVRPYLSDVASQEGSSVGQTQRVTALDIDFYKTIGGEVGVSRQEEDGTETEETEDLQFRTQASPMSTRLPEFTGIYHFTFLEGNDRKSEYFIRQKYPQPMTILGVVDTVEIS